ncbi:ribokinase [Synechococcus sp. RSCCF101]|nr:ribokinase [Synechococcus sp. RSCCF101]
MPLEALPPLSDLQLAVVGHTEVVTFVRVDRLPRPGEVAHGRDLAVMAAGGGPVVAAQMARLRPGRVRFLTALGRDAAGARAAEELVRLGLDPHIAWRDAPTRQAITFVESGGERTITVIGERLQPCAADALPWTELADRHGVFATACDAPALQLARRARVLTATPRVRQAVLEASGVRLDSLIGSALDPGEALAADQLPAPPVCVIRTAGAAGGEVFPGGRFSAPPRTAAVVDAYGAGDSFAAGVTVGLAAGWSLREAISLGCHCGSACLDGQGPYATQLRLPDDGRSDESH